METRSEKIGWLATTSLILGILSFGLALASFIPIIYWRTSGGGMDAKGWALGMLTVLSLLGGLILGIPGFILGMIAFIRFRKQRDHNNRLRMATVGLILSGLCITVFLIYLTYIFILNPPQPPPVEITPFSLPHPLLESKQASGHIIRSLLDFKIYPPCRCYLCRDQCLFNFGWQVDENEVANVVKVIFAAFIDHSN